MTHAFLSRPARAAALALAIAASAGLVACGEDEEQEVSDVAIAYGASEGDEACDFLSASALDQLGGESGCSRVFGTVESAEFQIEEVSVEGERANATVRNVDTGNPVELQFVQEDGEWKISSFPGLGDFPVPPPEPPEDQGGGGEGVEEPPEEDTDAEQPPEETDGGGEPEAPPEETEP